MGRVYLCLGQNAELPYYFEKQKYISGISKNCVILFGKTHG